MIKDPTTVGVRMVLRDSNGLLVACKSVVLPFCCSIKEAEEAGLREDYNGCLSFIILRLMWS